MLLCLVCFFFEKNEVQNWESFVEVFSHPQDYLKLYFFRIKLLNWILFQAMINVYEGKIELHV